jgi:hypothetical protein
MALPSNPVERGHPLAFDCAQAERMWRSAPRGEDCQSLASDPESLRSYGSQIHRVTRDA